MSYVKWLKIAVLALSITLLMSFLETNPFTLIHFVYAADAYGNDINFLEVWQWNGTQYNLLANFTSSGGSTRVADNQTIKFIVNIKFNDTLASDTSQAVDYTKVLMNITNGGSVWTNAEFNNTASSQSGNFYWMTEEGVWNQTDYPLAGISYECSVVYQGYY